MSDTRAHVCCCPACSRVAQGHACSGSGACLSEMNADLLLMVFAEPPESTPEWAATRIQSYWRGVLGRDDCQVAKQAKAKKERRAKRKVAATRIQACWRGYVARDAYWPAALDLFEWEERLHGVNSELGRAKALVAASKSFDAVYAAAYAEQVAFAKHLLGHMHIRQSATRLQACWRGVLGRKYCKAAKQAKAKKMGSLSYTMEELQQMALETRKARRAHDFRQADELRSVIRRHGYEVEQLLALTVSNAPHLQPSELLRLAVQWREARRMHDFERADELLALACHHGYDEHEFEKLSGVPPARRQMAAKQAKAKKMGSQLVVGSTILGRSIANDEPLYGGKCGCVGLLTGVVPPCLGGSLTVFNDAPDAFYYAVWDYFERYPDKACDVREIHLAGSEVVYQDIASLRQLLSLGPPYKPHGNVDLQIFLAERREPLGYTKSGQRLVHSQDLIFMVAAAVFMQCDIVLLDSATAMPRHVIVRCQRPNSRRQRSPHAQLRSDEGMVPWVRICQLVKGALGRKVLSLKITPGRENQHVQGVRMSASGERIIDGLLARLRNARAELKLAADELAVIDTMLEYGADSVGVLQMTGDDKKPIICSACGKVHATRATVKARPGGLVCVSDCGLLTEGRRKRPAEGSGPPPPSKKRTQLAFSDEEQPPPPSTTYKQPSTADEVHPSGEPESAAMPPPAPQCASRNEPPALLVQCVSTEPSVAVPPSTLQPISDETKDALFAKYGRIEPVASPSFASLDLPPIDDANAGHFHPPRLDVHRSAAARGPGSEPALWFKQVPPRPPSSHAAAHRLLTFLILAVSLTDDGTRVGRGRGHL